MRVVRWRLQPVLPDWSRFPQPNLATLSAARVARLGGGNRVQSGNTGYNVMFYSGKLTKKQTNRSNPKPATMNVKTNEPNPELYSPTS